EADDVADDRPAQRRPVPARGGGDLDRRPSVPGQEGRLPGRQPARTRTVPADGSNLRPASSRLSPWWSCVSSTASTGPSASGATAGPVSLRDEVPQPNAYRRPAGSNVGSVRIRQPAASISAVGPPTWVTRTAVTTGRAATPSPARRRRSSPSPAGPAAGARTPGTR